MLEQSTTQAKIPSDHQPQEAEEDEASEEDTTLNQEHYSSYSVEKIRDTQHRLDKSQYKSRRK
jgi:hypothetical protein